MTYWLLKTRHSNLSNGFSFIELIGILFILTSMISFAMFYSCEFLLVNQLQSLRHKVSHIIKSTRIRAQIADEILFLSAIDKNWNKGIMLYKMDQHNVKILNIYKFDYPKINLSWHGFHGEELLVFSSDLKSNSLNGYFLLKAKTKQYKLVINKLGRIREIMINER